MSGCILSFGIVMLCQGFGKEWPLQDIAIANEQQFTIIVDSLLLDSSWALLKLESFLEVSFSWDKIDFEVKTDSKTVGFYLISCWYKREEAQKRFTIYWCSVLAANMVGGLLASAIANMDGIQHYHSWRWVFILEGTATIIIGLAAFPLVTDFPEDARWLSEEEKSYIIARAGANSARAEPFTIRRILSIVADPKSLAGGVMYFGGSLSTFATVENRC